MKAEMVQVNIRVERKKLDAVMKKTGIPRPSTAAAVAFNKGADRV